MKMLLEHITILGGVVDSLIEALHANTFQPCPQALPKFGGQGLGMTPNIFETAESQMSFWSWR